MTYFDKIEKCWQAEISKLHSTDWFKKLFSAQLKPQHYKSLMRETYFQAGMNPQIQAMTTAYLDVKYRNLFKRFYQHAISEIGHDLLALNDLKTMGVDVEKLVKGRPLPGTVALIAFPIYEMQFRSPLSYLGYLFHLEFMPMQGGKEYIEKFKKGGVPESAMTFLEEHSTVDVHHTKLIREYIGTLVTTDEECEQVMYAATVTCQLHGRMILDAFEAGEREDIK